MLLRISLIVVIIAGLATAAISQLKVAGNIKELQGELEGTKKTLETTQNDERKAKSEVSKTKKDLEIVKKDLTTATNSLTVMTAKKEEQEQRADKHAAALEVALKERQAAKDELAKWDAVGFKAENVQAAMAEKKKIQEERDAYSQEKDLLLRNNRHLQAQLALFTNGANASVVMRQGLKGKVISVDPKWQFVVLDVGRDQGAEERGEMLVSRTGKLVAKIRITNLSSNRCVANILPEWKQSDIVEGDQALYFAE